MQALLWWKACEVDFSYSTGSNIVKMMQVLGRFWKGQKNERENPSHAEHVTSWQYAPIRPYSDGRSTEVDLVISWEPFWLWL